MHDKDHTIILTAKTDILSDECLFNAFYKGVSGDRRKKTDGYRFAKDKYLSLGAEILLYEALDRFGFDRGACEGGEIRFVKGDNGKPYIAGHGNIFFNISHSGDYVMCVVSDREAGCDIQKMEKAELSLAERFFLPQEYEVIAMQPDEESKRRMFYRYWTLKESYMKVTGRGMSLPLDAFEIRTYGMTEPVTAELVARSAEEADRRFYFKEFDTVSEYCCAICIEDSPADVQMQLVDLGEYKI